MLLTVKDFLAKLKDTSIHHQGQKTMAAVAVRPIQNQKEFQAFFEFPWHLYRDDPNWVPPLLSIRRELLDKNKNPAWEYMDGEYFAAWRGDEIVGTVVALINHRHNEFHNERVGWFGLFEVRNDQEAATALLNTAADWVKAQGYHLIRGPQITTHEECGLLVHNFNRPVVLMPYNYPYYQDLVETAGFTKAMDVHSIYVDRELVAQANTNDRMARLVRRTMERSNITIRPIDTRRKKQEFQLFKELYNAAWDANWGFVPMTERELDALVESLGMFFDSRMAFFAMVDGEPAGFMLSLPDFNEVLQKAYPRPGEPELWTMVKAGWYWKVKNIIRGVRAPLMGVKAEFRNKGVDLVLLHKTLNALLALPYDFLDAGWILETNELVKIGENLGGKVYKTHRFYEKHLR